MAAVAPRHLLSVRDLTADQIRRLVRQARALKKARRTPAARSLKGKTLGLLFQKPSVRTRLSFEVGMLQLGGKSVYMDATDLGGRKRESPKDLARVLSRYLDGIVTRTFAHADAEALARWSGIPVINGLSDFTHPCQALGDLMTLAERFGRLKGLRVSYIGDGNNVCHALLEAAALVGLHLAVATPAGHRPHGPTLRWAGAQAHRAGGSVRWTAKPEEAIRGAEAVYTDVWTSMGQERQGDRRRAAFRRFQINETLLERAPGALFMHCLPAHRGEEVTDSVMDSPRAIVYDQAENRLHIQKAILLMLLSR